MRDPAPPRAPAALPLLAAAVALFAAAPAAAQFDCLPPGWEQHATQPVCNFPPLLSLAPGTAQVSQPSVPVTITVSDHLVHGDTGSFRIFVGGVDVTASWPRQTSITGSGTGLQWNATASGSIALTTSSPSKTVMTRLCDVDGCEERTATYTLALPGVAVTPDGGSGTVTAASSGQYQFIITNQGTTTATFLLSPACRDAATGAAVSPCTVSPTSWTLAPGVAGGAIVTFGTATVGQVVQIQVEAQQQGAPGVRDAGWRMVTVMGTGTTQRAPVVSVVDLNSAAMIDRGQCVTVAVGPGAAYECGDLRAAHALPAHRTRGRTWAPVLLYNSQHAHPRPTLYADVTLPADGLVPTEVRATVTLANGTSHTRTFAGAGWQPGTTRRIGVQWDGISMATQVHGYSLQVTNVYGTTQVPGTAVSGELVVVNRNASRFGAGWWLAGWEEIHCIDCPTGGNRLLWVGGDGSTRIYEPTVPGQWAHWTALHPDRSVDTLSLTAPGGVHRYTRRIPGGGEVHLNGGGRHVATVNRLQQVTTFELTPGTTRLVGIVPSGGGPGLRWDLVYDGSDRLISASAGSGRSVNLAYSLGGRRVTSITDPDGLGTGFGYTDGSARITDRYGKDGTRVEFTYGIARKLTQVRTHMQGTAAHGDVVSGFEPAEAKGVSPSAAVAASVAVADAFTLLDGPRTDVDDRTHIWVGRFGAPVRIRDAAGGETRIARGDARFPALATTVTDPAGLMTTAAYDARGRVDSTAVVSPLGTNQNQVTKYTWDDTWDRPTSVSTFAVVPGVSRTALVAPSSTAYDAANGNVLWQQQGDATRRTNFRYYTSGAAAGQLRAVQAPLDQNGLAAVDSLWYDGLGNLAGTVNPLGHLTLHYRDALGRDTLTITPIDAATAHLASSVIAGGVRARTAYDVMDRPWRTETVGPARTHPWNPSAQYQPPASPAERLTVETSFDAVGRPLSVMRTIDPDDAMLGSQLTTFEYDRAGRKTTETGNGVVQRFEYDPAGNATAWVTGRNLRITRTYDALGRLLQRSVPGVDYAKTGCPHSWCTSPVFPVYPNTTGEGYRIEEAWTHFRYDAAGRMVLAENGDARVRRSYFPSGALATDSLMLRGQTGVDFPDRYGMAHAYDLAGRVTGLQHPTNLALGSATEVFEYDPATGNLSLARDRLNHQFTFGYDRLGRRTESWIPGGVVDSLRYDVGGRLTTRRARSVAAPSAPLMDEQFTYDARGKVLHVYAGSSLQRGASWFTQWYSGLGNLVATDWDNVGGSDWQREEYSVDPLGNVVIKLPIPPGGDSPSNPYRRFRYSYNPLSGSVTGVVRLPSVWEHPANQPNDETTRAYDASGNQVGGSQVVEAGSGGNKYVARRQHSRSYFDGEERMRVFQEYDGRFTQGSSWGTDHGVWEEYRYDPLGRRVMVTTRRESPLCTAPGPECISAVTRFVWSGDQILWELKSATGSYAGDAGGTVSYFHAGGIDRPLVITKGSSSIVPHQSWRGQFARGTFAGGARAGQPSDCTSYPPQNGCLPIRWPGWATTAWHEDAGTQPVTGYEHYWFGSLAVGMRDASGQMYMRNRYYDPQTGQFTQPDPIGLAGGLNSYGFAAGDPVTYSDPYGLKAQECPPCDDGEAKETASAPPRESGALASPGLADPVLWGTAIGAGFVTRLGGKALAGVFASRLPRAVASTFEGGSYTATTLAADLPVARVFGGGASVMGRFWTNASYTSGSTARTALQLPAENATTMVAQGVIPKGTTIFQGTVAGSPTGAVQIFVRDASAVRITAVRPLVAP